MQRKSPARFHAEARSDFLLLPLYKELNEAGNVILPGKIAHNPCDIMKISGGKIRAHPFHERNMSRNLAISSSKKDSEIMHAFIFENIFCHCSVFAYFFVPLPKNLDPISDTRMGHFAFCHEVLFLVCG